MRRIGLAEFIYAAFVLAVIGTASVIAGLFWAAWKLLHV